MEKATRRIPAAHNTAANRAIAMFDDHAERERRRGVDVDPQRGPPEPAHCGVCAKFLTGRKVHRHVRGRRRAGGGRVFRAVGAGGRVDHPRRRGDGDRAAALLRERADREDSDPARRGDGAARVLHGQVAARHSAAARVAARPHACDGEFKRVPCVWSLTCSVGWVGARGGTEVARCGREGREHHIRECRSGTRRNLQTTHRVSCH